MLITQAGRAQEAAPAGSGSTDAGPIDTGITVQSGRAIKSPHTIDSAQMKSGMGAQLPRQKASPNVGDRATPNAIGLPVAGRGSPQAALPAPPSMANPTAPANAGVAVGGSSFARPAAGGPATTVSRAAISGTGIMHPGAGPGIVRGTPKSLGTVSGTNVQPRR